MLQLPFNKVSGLQAKLKNTFLEGHLGTAASITCRDCLGTRKLYCSTPSQIFSLVKPFRTYGGGKDKENPLPLQAESI